MMQSSAAMELRAFLERAATRLRWIDTAIGAAAGLTVAFVAALLGIPPRGASLLTAVVALIAAIVGAGVQLARTATSRRQVAREIEARAPKCRNVVFTADELCRTAERTPADVHATPASFTAAGEASLVAPAYVGDMVVAQAAQIVRTLDLAALFPARNALLALTAGVALVGTAAARDTLPLRTASRAIRRAIPAAAVAIENIEVTITPPAYAAQPPQTLRNVARVDALNGSRIRLRVRASADSLAVQTLQGTRTIGPTSAELFTLDLPAEQDGFVTLAPRTAGGREGAHRLIGITVKGDQLPHVRIAAPGHDLFLKDARRTIQLGVDADDDLGLASLRLRYTKVSGSGERFTFAEGEVPLDLTRVSQRAWKATGAFRLDSLGLSPGDMVVYRAVATDRRPGALPQESDSYIVEIVAPGSDAAAGFSIDPDQERYAVSQQMVILKTERLIARRATMHPDSANLASQEIAAEQRKVRAEFVFMMGGEMADAPDPDASMTDLNEEAEAEGEADIAAGRLANQGRMALTRAIRYMSRAVLTLTNVELTDALKSEKAALAQLEQAFSRTRILLRALSERERLDMTRRMSAPLTDARSDRRGAVAPPTDAQGVALRRALAAIATVVQQSVHTSSSTSVGTALTALAETVLRVDPSSPPLQRVSSQLSEASSAISRGQRGIAQQKLDSATANLAAVLRRDAPSIAPTAPSLVRSQLGGALGDALRAPAAQGNGRPASRATGAPIPPQR